MDVPIYPQKIVRNVSRYHKRGRPFGESTVPLNPPPAARGYLSGSLAWI